MSMIDACGVVTLRLNLDLVAIMNARIKLSQTNLSPAILTRDFCKFIAQFILDAFGNAHQLKEVENYVHSVLESTNLVFSVVILALYYIHKLKSKSLLCIGLEKRTFVVSLMLAMKTLCDNTFSNLSWELVSGIPLFILNKEERKILSWLDYDLMISESLYFNWMQMVEDQVDIFKSTILSEKQTQRMKHITSIYTSNYANILRKTLC